MAEQKGVCLYPPARAPKFQLTFEASVSPLYFQCWDTARKCAGCVMLIFLVFVKSSVHTVRKAGMFHSQSHLRKPPRFSLSLHEVKSQCTSYLTKGNTVSVHPHQELISQYTQLQKASYEYASGHTVNYQLTPFPSWKRPVPPKGVFLCWNTAGVQAGFEPSHWGLLDKRVF